MDKYKRPMTLKDMMESIRPDSGKFMAVDELEILKKKMSVGPLKPILEIIEPEEEKKEETSDDK